MIRRTRRGGGEWWSSQEMKGLVFLGAVVLNTIATPDAGLARASGHPTPSPGAVGKADARPKIVEGFGHARGMNAGVALEGKDDRSVGVEDGLLNIPDSDLGVPGFDQCLIRRNYLSAAAHIVRSV